MRFADLLKIMIKKLKRLKKFLPRREGPLYKQIFAWAVTVLVGIFLLAMISFVTLIAFLSILLPDVSKLDNLRAAESTEIFDKDGKLLYTIHGDENREKIDYTDISEYVIDATVAIEDSDFWDHKGFDLSGLAVGLMHEIFGVGTSRGGSTITQQYVKNALLSPERSYLRKAKELILAIRMERVYSKEEILGLYLNRIPYGNNAYGIQKASEVYFDKSAKDLDLSESVVLASLPQAPSKYNPYGDNKFSHLLKDFSKEELFIRNIDEEKDLQIEEYIRGLIGQFIDLGDKKIYIAGRTDLVLKRMFDLEMITAEQRQSALDEIQKIQFTPYKETITAPHFVLYIKQVLESKYGKDVVESGGLKVYTTLDSELQEYAEQVATEQGEANQKNYGADNMAILAVNVKDGSVLAMVGSRDYNNDDIDGKVNVVFRPRQPGSSFKPIVYAQAFYNGYAPASVTYDIPTRIGYDRPQDYDGKWMGQISLRKALGQSRNIPAIQAYFLAQEQGPIIDLAQQMGVTTLDKTRSYGYPLALGSGEVPLAEMVTAYATFANGGKKPDLNSILKVENSNGDVLEEWKPKEFKEVLDPQIAYLINNILSDRSVAIGPAMFVDGKINAAKTGTSTKQNKKDARAAGESVRPSDNWTLGYTPSVAVGVWVGNTDGTGLNYNGEAYYSAAPVFKKVMTKALEGKPSEEFQMPEGIKTVQVSKASGKLPGPNTPSDMVVSDVFTSFSVPTEVDNGFYTVKIDKVSGLLATEYTPPDAVETVTFQNYQPIAPLLNWANEIRDYYVGLGKDSPDAQVSGSVRIGVPPTEYDNVHTADTLKNVPSINIITPISQSILPLGGIIVEIDLKALNGVDRVEYYMDDDLKYTSSGDPYFGYMNLNKFIGEDGSKHLIVAKVIDKLGYASQSAIEIKISYEKSSEEQ